MKYKLVTDFKSGQWVGVSPGTVVELTDEDAAPLLDAGHIEHAIAKPKPAKKSKPKKKRGDA